MEFEPAMGEWQIIKVSPDLSPNLKAFRHDLYNMVANANRFEQVIQRLGVAPFPDPLARQLLPPPPPPAPTGRTAGMSCATCGEI